MLHIWMHTETQHMCTHMFKPYACVSVCVCMCAYSCVCTHVHVCVYMCVRIYIVHNVCIVCYVCRTVRLWKVPISIGTSKLS